MIRTKKQERVCCESGLDSESCSVQAGILFDCGIYYGSKIRNMPGIQRFETVYCCTMVIHAVDLGFSWAMDEVIAVLHRAAFLVFALLGSSL